MGSHIYLPPTRTTPAFTPQPQGVTALWLVLIAPTQEGKARLSWPRWLVTYRDKYPAPGIERGHGHPPSTNRARRRLTSLIETNALPLHQTTTRWRWKKGEGASSSEPSMTNPPSYADLRNTLTYYARPSDLWFCSTSVCDIMSPPTKKLSRFAHKSN